MKRHVTPRAVSRAKWFAQLSAALDEGDAILAQLIAARFGEENTERLRQQLIALRAELERLNRVDLAKSRLVGTTWPDNSSKVRNRTRPIHPDWHTRRD